MTEERRARLARAAFWLAAAFALVMASLPHPPQVPGEPTDKVQHMLAFGVLTLLAVLAFPRTTWWRIALGLSLFGIVIEIVQAIPVLHRDSDWLDWVADTAAVGAMLALIAVVRPLLRRTSGRR